MRMSLRNNWEAPKHIPLSQVVLVVVGGACGWWSVVVGGVCCGWWGLLWLGLLVVLDGGCCA